MIKLKQNRWAGSALLVGVRLWGCSAQQETSEEDSLSQKDQAATLTGAPQQAKATSAKAPRPSHTTDAARAADGRHRVWVVMKNTASLAVVNTKDWKARGQSVHQNLVRSADQAQASLKSWLKDKKV